MTIQGLAAHFNRIYTRKNRVLLPSLSELVNMLYIAVGGVKNSVREELPKKLIGKSLAHVAAWTFATINHFKDLPFTEALCKKYPTKCGYCGKPHCRCNEARRKKHIKGRLSATRLKWNLRDHQKNLNSLYGQKNSEEGIDYVFNRLMQEIVELTQNMAGSHIGEKAEVIEADYAFELADIFAWTIALASILEIDLERAISIWYGKGCVECHKAPCGCRKFMVSKGRIHHVFVRSLEGNGTRP